MNSETNREELSDIELARLVRDLPREMEPGRDLWSGIERQMLDHPQRVKGDGHAAWMPYAVAASLLLAVSAMTLNVLQWQGSPAAQMTGLDRMELEYVQLRNPMVEEFTRVNESLDPGVKQELYRNFEIMEQARQELEKQVRENPENQRLVDMLIKIHEQELELLRQDYTRSSRSM